MNRLDCILMVDDDRVSNYITENVIRSVGAASMINIVTDGMAALDYINYQCSDSSNYACPDLIILDMNMRLMNGMEFMRELDKLNLIDKIPVIILSSTELKSEEMDEMKKLGIHHFYQKPMSAENLIDMLDDLFHPA